MKGETNLKMIECWIDGAINRQRTEALVALTAFKDKASKPFLRVRKAVEPWGKTAPWVEYKALEFALNILKKHKSQPILIYSDLLFLTKQMRERKVYDEGGIYTEVAKNCVELLKEFPRVEFHWIPREINKAGKLLGK